MSKVVVTLPKGKSRLSQQREMILVAGSALGSGLLIHFLPERLSWGWSLRNEMPSDEPAISAENPPISTDAEEVNVEPTHETYHKIEAQDCGITSNMTFGQAFAQARRKLGKGCVFAWHGKLYNTFYKEEWLEMDADERQAFLNSINYSHVPAAELPPDLQPNPLDNNDLTPVISGDTTVPDAAPITLPKDPDVIQGTLRGYTVIGIDFNHDGYVDELRNLNTGQIFVDTDGKTGLDDDNFGSHFSKPLLIRVDEIEQDPEITQQDGIDLHDMEE